MQVQISKFFGRLVNRELLASPLKRTNLVGPTPRRNSCTAQDTKVCNVLVHGAAGQVGQALVPQLARGVSVAPNTRVKILLLDVPKAEKVLDGVKMELEDCAYETLHSVEYFTDPVEAYRHADFVIMLANLKKLGADDSRASLIETSVKIHRETAEVIKESGNRKMKMVVVSNPTNTNTLLLVHQLKGVVEPQNFSSLSRLDHNRAIFLLAQKLGVTPNCISKVIVWGNHSPSMVPDITHAEVTTDGKTKKVMDVLKDEKWYRDTLIPFVRKRGYEIIPRRGNSSSFSVASATMDHMRDWLYGPREGDYVSMGHYTTQPLYGGVVPQGYMYALPTVGRQGKAEIVTDLKISDFVLEMMAGTAKELKEEWAAAAS